MGFEDDWTFDTIKRGTDAEPTISSKKENATYTITQCFHDMDWRKFLKDDDSGSHLTSVSLRQVDFLSKVGITDRHLAELDADTIDDIKSAVSESLNKRRHANGSNASSDPKTKKVCMERKGEQEGCENNENTTAILEPDDLPTEANADGWKGEGDEKADEETKKEAQTAESLVSTAATAQQADDDD